MALPAFALLAATASLASASLRLRGLAAFLLATYLFAAAEIVGLTLALSPFHAVDASGYLVGETLVGAVVLPVWHRLGHPRPSRPKLDRRMLTRHPLLLALGLVVGLTLLTQPAISALVGWLAYGETLKPIDWFGAAAIAAALVLVRLPERGLRTPAEQPS